MDTDRRRAAVAALRELARSGDSRDRADAGRGLAGFAETEEASGALLELVLDPDDTWVTRVTAEAALRRQDRAGLTVVASALAVADAGHGDWIQTAVVDVFGVFADERDHALALCEDLARDPDERVARGARELRGILAGLRPVLHPT